MTPDDLLRLQRIVEALDSAIRFAKGRQRGDLDSDDMLRFALGSKLNQAIDMKEGS